MVWYFAWQILQKMQRKILIKKLATKWHSWHLWLEVLARVCRSSFSCYLNIHSSENYHVWIISRRYYTCTFSLSFRTEWVTPVPDFREDLARQYRIFNHPIFHLRSEVSSPPPKRCLRLPRPRIWPRLRPPPRTHTQTVLYIIFKPLKYDFEILRLKNFPSAATRVYDVFYARIYGRLEKQFSSAQQFISV